MADRLTAFTFRNGEKTTREFARSGRFYHSDGNWFFKTREGINYGPYSSRTECKYAYVEFLEVVSNKNELSSLPVDFGDTGSNWKVPKISFN
ncbi:DUF6316 family protein [Aliikangiella coralliicola]|uniref:DUF6316 domain-containing protein n=1 Tax=Aliikangiella coralliicola TaxID=2592383 RepID=A0A545UAU6_9GAMM|nr:DUF6316 family protein [Aliikangiella coralliicola]TQV86577.1 hypothetical protein FLL46_16885 [Aliikangiella coralliicola]